MIVSRTRQDGRQRLESPYSDAHARSVARRSQERSREPGLRELLAWFMARYREEAVLSIHASGVEWEPPGRIEGERQSGGAVTDPGGGSSLGAPRWTSAFRNYVTGGSPSRVEHAFSDGRPEVGSSYATPLRATIAYLSRSGHPVKMHWVERLARNDGDYLTLARLSAMHEEYAEAVTRDALGLVWRHYRETPEG